MTLAVKVALNLNTTNQLDTKQESMSLEGVKLLAFLICGDMLLDISVCDIIRPGRHSAVCAASGHFITSFRLCCIRACHQGAYFQKKTIALVFVGLLGDAFGTGYSILDRFCSLF